MKSSVVGDGSAGVQDRPQKFWFAENLGKISENPGKNSTHRCLTSKKKGLQKNTWTSFWRSHQKKLFVIFTGKNLQAKVAQKTFRSSLGKFGHTSFSPPKFCLLLHVWKGISVPVAPLLKGQKRKCPAMPQFSGVPVHIILHALSLLVVGYNVSLQWT